MNTHRSASLSLFVGLFTLLATARGDDWRQFRGTDTNGVAAETRLPTHWSETENVLKRDPRGSAAGLVDFRCQRQA